MIDPFASRPTAKALQFQPGDKVILCEGNDECAVVRQLTSHWKPRKPVIGKTADGFSRRDELIALVDQVSIRSLAAIGFVFDAEDSRSKAEAKLRADYDAAGLVKPKQPGRLKISVVDRTRIQTGYLINPPGKNTGNLESLFLPQIQASPQWRCIDSLLKCYQAECPTKEDGSKVAVRTFIAHGNAYNTGLMVALRDRLLSLDDAEFDPLRNFLSRIESV